MNNQEIPCTNCCGAGYFGLNSDCRTCGGTGRVPASNYKRDDATFVVPLKKTTSVPVPPADAQLKEHIKRCPIGWFRGKLVHHRSTTDQDVIDWIVELRKLGGVD